MKTADIKNIAIISDINPFPINNGAKARISSLIRVLKSNNFRINYILICQPIKGYEDLEELRRLVSSITLVRGNIEGTKQEQEKIRRQLKQHFCEYAYHSIIVEFAHVGKVLNGMKLDSLKIIDTHNIYFLRKEIFQEKGYEFRHNLDKITELDTLSYFDVLMAIQAEEVRILKSMFPEKQVILVGHGASECSKTTPNKKYAVQTDEKIVMVVGYKNDPNKHGLHEFISKAWPQIRTKNKDVYLRVCGPLSETIDTRRMIDKGVIPVGYKPSLKAEYERASVVINPVLAGTGLEIKSVEALLHGKALVSTRAGATGLVDKYINKAYLVINNYEHFASLVNRLLTDLNFRVQIESEAKKYAETFLCKDIVYKPLLQILNKNS